MPSVATNFLGEILKRTLIFILALPLFGALTFSGGCVNREQQKAAKETQAVITDQRVHIALGEVRTQDVQETFEISGNITTAEDSQVSARQPGKVARVFVSDGDHVQAGQIVAELDATPLRAQYQQALAQFQNAQSGLSTAVGNLRYGPLKSEAAVRQARAGLRSAESTLARWQTGARTEERAQAQANLEAAKTNLKIAKDDLERKKNLVAEGALAKVNQDQSENVYAAALQQYNNALQAELIVERGSRTEDIDVAKANVAQARDQLTNAKAAQKLDVLYTDAVNSARAQVQAAKAQLELAKSNLDDTVIRTPFAGQVAGKPIQSGTIISAGTPVVRIIGGQGAYFEGQVPQNHLKDVPIGTQVTIQVDSLPGKQFHGSVSAVNPLGVEIGRLFKVRITLTGDLQGLKPNMFAHGTIVSRRVPNAAVVPNTAIVAIGQKSVVFTEADGKAHANPVELGIRLESVTQVTSGLSPGQKIIVEGQDSLEEGSPVTTEKTQPAQS